MRDNLPLGNIRVVFAGEKPFTVKQVGQIFVLLEDIYKEFSSYVLEEDSFSLLIDNVSNEYGYFDMIPVPTENSTIKFSDFQEIILCVLYSIYSSTFNNVLETIDSQAKEIQSNVLDLLALVEKGQKLIMLSVIEDKIVKVNILPDKQIVLEKEDPNRPQKCFEDLESILKAYQSNKKEEFVGSNFEGADLSNTELSGANFANAELYQVILNNANLTDTSFLDADVSNAHLNNVKLNNSYLVNADFSGVELKDSDLSGANLSEADFSSSNLSGAKLYNVNITSTDFSGANLTNAKFMGSIKTDSETDFSSNANWWDAEIDNDKFLKWLKKNYPQK